jgi:uncharacterized protein YggU (UPF0235/DUF167 family)
MGGGALLPRHHGLSAKLSNKDHCSVAGKHLGFAVRLTPKGGRDALDGWNRDAESKPQLKVRVAAPPEDGKANAALTALLAKRLGVAKSMVRIRRGETARVKMIEVEGDTAAIATQLESLEHLA